MIYNKQNMECIEEMSSENVIKLKLG